MITHDKCTFSANDGVKKTWTQERDTFLQPKKRRGHNGLGISFSFERLNLSSLSLKKR